MPTQPSTPSPWRLSVDRFLEQLAEGAIATQGSMGSVWIRTMMRQRGWDSRALASQGPLSAVSDVSLSRLLDMLAERLEQLVEDGPGGGFERSALEELRRALA